MGYPQPATIAETSEAQLINSVNYFDKEISRLRELRIHLELFSQKLESRPSSDEAKMSEGKSVPNDSLLYTLNTLSERLSRENDKISIIINHYRSLINF